MHHLMSKTATSNNQEMNKKRFYNKPKWLANTRYSAVVAPLPPTGAVTWNPTDKSSYMVLSNNNLTASTNYFSGFVRANVGKSTGKWYWELTIISVATNGYLNIGVTPLSLSSETTQWYTGEGNIRIDNIASPGYVGRTIGIMMDMDNHILSTVGNQLPNNTIGNDTYFPTFGDDNAWRDMSTYSSAVANFKGPFVNAIPSGYSAYETVSASTPLTSITTVTPTMIASQPTYNLGDYNFAGSDNPYDLQPGNPLSGVGSWQHTQHFCDITVSTPFRLWSAYTSQYINDNAPFTFTNQSTGIVYDGPTPIRTSAATLSLGYAWHLSSGVLPAGKYTVTAKVGGNYTMPYRMDTEWFIEKM